MHTKSLTAADIEHHLAKELGYDVSVVLTDNSSTFISFKKNSGSLKLRLHNMFRFAQDRELDALGAFIRGKNRQKARRLREFFRESSSLVKKAPARRERFRHAGAHHDLGPMFKELKHRYFGSAVKAGLTWGREARPGKRLKHIRIGSYDWEKRVIRVHPRLDRASVPGYVVRAVLFHEMCHAYLGTEKKNGRNLVHGPRFRELLSRCPDLDRAEKWQKNNLSKILAP